MILPQLLVRPNFIEPYEADVLYHYLRDEAKFARARAWSEDQERQHWVIFDATHPPHIEEILADFRARKKKAIEEFFGETLVNIGRLGIRKWVPGDYQSPHCDVGSPEGMVHITGVHGSLSLHDNDFATVTYLNDDFEGGETYFQNHGVQIVPRPGLMIAVPASHQYLHGVRPIISGNRFVLTSFWPRARTIVHNLIPSLPTGWFYDVENVDEIMRMIPPDALHKIPAELMPPDELWRGHGVSE